MNKTIIITHDPFAMESKAMVNQDGSIQYFSVPSNIQDMAAAIINSAYTKNIYDFKLSATPDTLEELIARVNNHEKKLYSENKIKIEGI